MVIGKIGHTEGQTDRKTDTSLLYKIMYKNFGT